MARFEYNGQVFEAPDDATPDELEELLGTKSSGSTGALKSLATEAASKAAGLTLPGPLGLATEELTKRAASDPRFREFLPELSRKGFREAEQAITPEETDTSKTATARRALAAGTHALGKVAPEFLTPESLIPAAGAATKLTTKALGMAGKGASYAGKLSGATPEALQRVAAGELPIFTAGVKEAGKAVGKAADAALGGLNPAAIKDPEKLIEISEQLAKGGGLTPGMAVRARQAVGDLFDSRRLASEAQKRLYNLFDKIAKSDPDIAKADRLRTIAEPAARLRNLLPVNKAGEVRQLISGAGLVGAASNPLVAAALSPLYSPLIQALLAKGGGAALRTAAPYLENPSLAGSLGAAAASRKKK